MNTSLASSSQSDNITGSQIEADNLSLIYQVLSYCSLYSPGYVNFQKNYTGNVLVKDFINKLLLDIWDNDYLSYRQRTQKLKKLGSKTEKKDRKTLMNCCTAKIFHIYWRSSYWRLLEPRLLVGTTTMRLVGHFKIEKTWELIAWKYYWPTLQADIKVYVKRFDIYISSKYGNLQSLFVTNHYRKDLSMDFVLGLLTFTNWKCKIYNSILVILDHTKMVYYKLVKVRIDVSGLGVVIIDVLIRRHSLPNSIVSNRDLVFISKFSSSLCCFLGIKKKQSTTFHSPRSKQQNSIMEAYLRAFVNYQQNDWAPLLLMLEFVYNDTKNVNNIYTLFELNYGFYSRVSYNEDVDPYSKSKTADQLATE